MAEVLPIPIQPNSTLHFGSSTLHRSTSQTSFFLSGQAPYSRTSDQRHNTSSQTSYDTRTPASAPSSAPSSPRFLQPDFSERPSYASTPSSSISLDEDCNLEGDDLLFPSYDDRDSYDVPKEKTVDSCVTSTSTVISPETSEASASASKPTSSQHATLSYPESANPLPIAGDDTSVKAEPSRHVDYLSHNWKEEDIWSSWRHIVAKRKIYGQCSRLENASWRTWAKSKHRLKTVSPDTLNWMKDHDVTWLYGPLQTGTSKLLDSDSAPPASRLSRSNSFITTKKPILKKRSLSEVMLQRSISSSTLMKQAIDALRAQEPGQRLHERPVLGGRAYSDFASSYNPVLPPGNAMTESPTALPSSSSSGITTPSERRHIHFNDKVEQCIAINKDIDDHEGYYGSAICDDDDSSDDGVIMMKEVHGKERKLSNRNSSRSSFTNDNKTIAMLPSTTLKYRGDTPEPSEQAPNQRGGFWNAAGKLARSPSQETLKPSKRSCNFLLDDEDDEADITWQPTPTRRDNVYIPQHGMTGPTFEEDGNDLEGKGLRRTPSGMFMPYEEDEDDVVATGLFGKVVDTVNTARDIAHVIWNVGWRR